MTYKIPPLDPGKAQIRLLRLLPHEDASSGIICGSLRVVDLDDKPSYAALSYTWEPMGPLHTILIDQQPFSIGDNLWHFLSTTAAPLQEGETSLWVDQICIDQHSLTERNHQVSLMGRVYSQAYPTYVWLGPEAKNSDIAISFLNDLWHTENSREAIIDRHKELLPIEDLAKAVTSLFQRPYWTRLWVVQEFKLSQYLILVCGSSTLHFHEGRITRARAYLLCSACKPVLQLQAIRVMETGSGYLTDIATCLFLFGDRECSMPHDRVFGLLGRTSDQAGIPVDYSVPIEKLALQVLQTMAPAMLKSSDRILARTVLSGKIKDPETLDLTSDVLFHVARGLVPFALLTAGREHGSEELSRMCQQISDSIQQNLKVDMKTIEYNRNLIHNEPENASRWFCRRRLGSSWAMRGIPKPQTPSEKLEAKDLARSSKRRARDRNDLIKTLERYVGVVQRTWPEKIQFAFEDIFKTKTSQGTQSDASAGLEADEVGSGAMSPTKALRRRESST